jgi:drug/metabolite transporter (DMT)-like permease
MLAVLSALGSALLVAIASVLQHRAGNGSDAPRLRQVLARPVWIWGSLAGIAGFALHLVALSHGALSVVQPLLVTGLLFALPMSRALDRHPVRLGDVAAAGAVVSGLALFQLTARPSAGRSVADLPVLGWCGGVAAAVIGIVLVLSARRRRDRAVWLGLCTGIAYGVVAALLKSALGVLAADGIAATLATWPLYGFAVLVGAAIVINQLAFNAGPLAQSLPLITIVDPVVSVVVGAMAFGETVSSSAGSVIGQVFGFVGMSVGVMFLSLRAEGQTRTIPPQAGAEATFKPGDAVRVYPVRRARTAC